MRTGLINGDFHAEIRGSNPAFLRFFFFFLQASYTNHPEMLNWLKLNSNLVPTGGSVFVRKLGQKTSACLGPP